MELLKKHIEKNVLANGYLVGEGVSLVELADFLSPYGEICLFEGEFGIEEARNLKEISVRACSEKRRVFYLLDASKMTRGVPESILKIVEDVPTGKHFFILSSDGRRPLPSTLRSRLVQLPKKEKHTHSTTHLKEFIGANFSYRQKLVKEISEDKEKFVSFLNDLEKQLIKNERHNILLKIQTAKEGALVFNISRKMCLEYVASLL